MGSRHFAKRHPMFVGRGFLPARRTDPYCIKIDTDEIHHQLWQARNIRNCLAERPRVGSTDRSEYLIRLMIAQGRIRMPAPYSKLVEVKDPEVWAAEAKDYRKVRKRKGRIRCQFCGEDYEKFSHKLIACPRCCQRLGLLQLRQNLYDENRNVKPEFKEGAGR